MTNLRLRLLTGAAALLVPFATAGCTVDLPEYKGDIDTDTDADYPMDGSGQLEEDEDTWAVAAAACEDACDVAVADVAELLTGEEGCSYACGIALSQTFDGGYGDVLLPLIEVEVGGEVFDDGACELVLECNTDCQRMAQDCIAPAPADSEYVAGCMAEFEQCEADEVCEVGLETCLQLASSVAYSCLNSGNPYDYCLDLFLEADAVCTCIYTECIEVGDATACIEAEPVAQPYAVSPGRWAIPRPFFEASMARLVGISTEVFLIPRVSDGALRGIEIGSVVDGDTLSRLGLQDGDVFRGLNGHSVAALFEHPGLALSALAGGEFAVLIHRGQQSRVIEYRVVD